MSRQYIALPEVWDAITLVRLQYDMIFLVFTKFVVNQINTICNILYYQQEAPRECRPPPRQIWGIWNSLARRETVYPNLFQDIPCSMPDLFWKIRSRVSRNVAKQGRRAGRQRDRQAQTNRDENATFAVRRRWQKWYQFSDTHPVISTPSSLPACLSKTSANTARQSLIPELICHRNHKRFHVNHNHLAQP